MFYNISPYVGSSSIRNFICGKIAILLFYDAFMTVQTSYDPIRYDTRCYFIVSLQADMSLRTETTTKKCKTEKKLNNKDGYARSNSKQSGGIM